MRSAGNFTGWPRVAFDSPCSPLAASRKRAPDASTDIFFHLAENGSAAVAGNIAPIVHTEAAFSRRLKELPHREAA
jgi:hypothetical protein